MVDAVAHRHRLTISPQGPDPRAESIHAGAVQLGLIDPSADGQQIGQSSDDIGIAVDDVVYIDGELSADDLARLSAVLVNPLLQTGTWTLPDRAANAYEIILRPGVTNAAADALLHVARQLEIPVERAATARRVLFGAEVDPASAERVITQLVLVG
jgi:phosphoribosylformylglycinamidine synthase